MSYATLAQLADSIGAHELAQVATSEWRRDPADPVVLDALLRQETQPSGTAQASVDVATDAKNRIQAAIDEADALIDAYLAKRGYELPLNPVPLVIASKARDIVRYMLHKNRLSGADDPILRDYQTAIKFLGRIAAGKIGLVMDDGQAVHQTGAKTGGPVRAAETVAVCRPRRWIEGWL